jgi:hypothetical protein
MKKMLLVSPKAVSLFLLFLLPFICRAQIVYTCLTPSVKVSANVQEGFKRYDIDIDKDNIPDIYIKHFHPDSSFQNVEFYCSDNLEEVLVDSNTLEPLVFKNNDTIQASGMLWYNTLEIGGNEALFMDNKWAGVSDGYIGLRIRKGTAWRYAWLHMSIPSDESSFTLIDYAYEKQSGQSIIAGSGKTNLKQEHDQASNLKIYYYDRCIYLSGTGFAPGLLEIWNANGQLIKSTHIASAGKYDISDLQAGTYIARFYNGTEYTVQKMIVY